MTTEERAQDSVLVTQYWPLQPGSLSWESEKIKQPLPGDPVVWEGLETRVWAQQERIAHSLPLVGVGVGEEGVKSGDSSKD